MRLGLLLNFLLKQNFRKDFLIARPLVLFALFAALAGCVTKPAARTESTKAQAVASTRSQYAAEPTRTNIKGVLPANLALKITNDFGEVRLRFGGFEHAFEVTAVAQAPIGQAMPGVRFDAQSGVIATFLPVGTAAALGQRIDIVVFVPEKHDVQVSTLRGMVEIRSLRSAVTVRSDSGNIAARGVQAAMDLQTGSGSIDVSLNDVPLNTQQRFNTRTGVITASFGPAQVAELALSTSALIATEFSVEISERPGEEPNKTGVVRLAGVANGVAANPQELLTAQAKNKIELSSKRGELRLYRRQAYLDAD